MKYGKVLRGKVWRDVVELGDRSPREPCCGDVAECCEEVLQNVAEKPWRWL